MKTLFAALFCTALLFSAPASAEDLSGFYTWANDVIVKTEFLTGENLTSTVVIRVKTNWDSEDVPQAYRSWLATYTVCEKNRQEVVWAEESKMRGFRSYILLADTSITQNVSSFSWVRANVEHCEVVLKTIRAYMEKKD